MTKETKKYLQKRLKAYSAAMAGAAVGIAVNGQVEYIDVDPDVVIDELGEFYDLDINQDGLIDFKVQYTTDFVFANYGFNLTTKGVNFMGFGKYNRLVGNIRTFGKGYVPYAYALEDSVYLDGPFGKFLPKATIQGFLGYDAFGVEYLTGYPTGDFGSEEDQFLGFVTNTLGEPHLGWIRLHTDVDTANSSVAVTIKDYAYNKIPMFAIYTGIGADMIDLPRPSDILAEDIDDNYNASDMKVTFAAASDETNIQQYGVAIAKSEEADVLTLDDFIMNEGGHGIDITPDGSADYEVILPLGQLDFNGDPVITGRAYKAIVYVFNEEPLYNLGFEISNEVTLNSPPEMATNVIAEDIADNLNASDMQVSFSHAADESGMDEYRVMVVPESDIATFDSAIAAAVLPANYTAVAVTGVDIEIILNPAALTYNGASINQNTDYYVFVVSSLNGATDFIVSGASNLISLGVLAPQITMLEIEDLRDEGNSSDLQIRYMVPADITNLEYAEFIFVKRETAESLSYEQIINLYEGSNRSYTEMTAGETDTIDLSPFVLDANLNFLTEGIEYFLYARSDPRNAANKENLSDPVAFILQSKLDRVEDVVVANIARNFDPADWLVLADKSEDESKLEEYRIMAVKAENAGSFDVDAANSVSESNYIALAPTGKNIRAYMPDDLNDVNGESITQSAEYQFFILSVANLKAKENKLSEASNLVSLEKVNSIAANTILNGRIYYAYNQINILVPDLDTDANVSVVSLDGRIVYQGILHVGETSIDPGHLKNGMYIVQVKGENGILAKKLLIQQ